jgi:hypothetical protein
MDAFAGRDLHDSYSSTEICMPSMATSLLCNQRQRDIPKVVGGAK